jgi:integrase
MPNKKSAPKSNQKPVKRLKSSFARVREFLTDEEIERLAIAASKHDAFGLRNSLMIKMAYQHALRASELLDIQWEQIDFENRTVTVKRVKSGAEAQVLTSSLTDDEIVSLNELKLFNETLKKSSFVFVGHRGSLFVDSFELMVKKAGESAKIGFPVHSHMLRHAKENA